jgi:hypothetical protein
MDKKLNILLVEDSEDDAALVLGELRRGGIEAVYERVDSAEGMQAALLQENRNVLVCVE